MNKNGNNKSKRSYLGYSVESLDLMESIQTEVFLKYGWMDLIDELFVRFFGSSDNFYGLPLRFLRIFLCNQLNPPIRGRVFDPMIVQTYIIQYFTNVLQILTKQDIESANSGGLGIIIVSMTIFFCHEFAYTHAYNSFPDLPKSKHLSLQIETSLRASQFHTAIFAHALNISSTKCASFPINLPKCGDCVTVLTSNNNSDPDIRVHFTELKLCDKRAVGALKNASLLKNKRNGSKLFTNTTCKMFSSCIEDFREIGDNCIFLLKIFVPENPSDFDLPVRISRRNMHDVLFNIHQKTYTLFKMLNPKKPGFPKFDSDFKEIIKIFESYSKSPSSLNSSVSSVSLQLSNKTNMRRNSMYSSNPLFDFESSVGASAMGGPSSGRGNRNGASARGRLNSSVSSASLQLSNNSRYSSNSLFDFEPSVGASAMGPFKKFPKSKLKSKNYNAMAGPGLGLEEVDFFLGLDSRNGSKTKNRSFAMGEPIPENTGSVMLTTGFGGPFKKLPKSKLKSKNYAAMAGPGPGLEEEEFFLRLDSRNGPKTKNRSFAMGEPIPGNTGSVMLTTGFGGPFKTVPKFKIGNVALDNRSLKSKSENNGSTLGVRSGLKTLPKPKFLNSPLTAMNRPNSGPVNGALTTMSRPNSAPINSAFAIGSSVLEGPSNAPAKNIKNLNN